MEISGIAPRMDIRLTNYEREKISIHRKLADSQISDGKRGKLKFRLRDIDERLIPKTMRNLS